MAGALFRVSIRCGSLCKRFSLKDLGRLLPISTYRGAPETRKQLRARTASLCNTIGQTTVPTKSLAALFATDVQQARPATNHVARLATLPRDVAGCCRSTARNGPSASRPRFAGDHEANLSARDSGGTTPSGRGSGEAISWTQMDPN